jgi:DNA-binding PadR family transcriptional regulator
LLSSPAHSFQRCTARGIGLAHPEWEASENNRRAKYYKLTKAGKRQLSEATEQWNRIALAMTKALEA